MSFIFEILTKCLEIYSVIFCCGGASIKKYFPLKNLNFGGKPVEGYATYFSHVPLINKKINKQTFFILKFIFCDRFGIWLGLGMKNISIQIRRIV
jgi:hypothetical protein